MGAVLQRTSFARAAGSCSKCHEISNWPPSLRIKSVKALNRMLQDPQLCSPCNGCEKTIFVWETTIWMSDGPFGTRANKTKTHNKLPQPILGF